MFILCLLKNSGQFQVLWADELTFYEF